MKKKAKSARIRHVILWQLKDELSGVEEKEAKAAIKQGLEALVGVVPGLKEVHVYTDGLPTSNADIMLDSLCEDEAALKAYAEHPEHVKVKDMIIKPAVKSRVCMDFRCDSC
ncbi:MAG: Dabb family protein [Lachnospiraceae bacterium]|nr:Dabb family protein [Lachnospiraceae bacterium]